MNRSGINSSQINGQRLAGWVVSAAAIVSAGVTSAAEPWRILGGGAYGDAAAVVTLTTAHNIAARCSALAETTSSVKPTTIFFGTATTRCEAMGNGAVLRNVAANAAADGNATGLALASDQLGESQAIGVVASASDAHIVHPGRVSILGEGAGSGVGLAIRMSPATGLAAGSGYGEATMQLSGEEFKRLDGFALSSSTATAELRNDYSAIIATYGAFDFGRTLVAEGRPFLRYQASAQASETLAVSAYALRTLPAQAVATAGCGSEVGFTRISPGAAVGAASLKFYLVDADQRHACSSTATVRASSLPAKFVTRYFAKAAGAVEAWFVPSLTANHYFDYPQLGEARSIGVVPEGDIAILGALRGVSSAYGAATYAKHQFATALSAAQAVGSSQELLSKNYKGHVVAGVQTTGLADSVQYEAAVVEPGVCGLFGLAVPADFHPGEASSGATSSGIAPYADQHHGESLAESTSIAAADSIQYFFFRGDASATTTAAAAATPAEHQYAAADSLGFAVIAATAKRHEASVPFQASGTATSRADYSQHYFASVEAQSRCTASSREVLYLNHKGEVDVKALVTGFADPNHYRAPGVVPMRAESIGFAVPADFERGAVQAQATAVGYIYPADFRRAASSAAATAYQTPIFAVQKYHAAAMQLCAVSALVGERLHPATRAKPSYSEAIAFAVGGIIRRAFCAGVGSSFGTSIGQSNVDVLAPASRAMTISVEERAMFAPEENRTMTVEA